MTVDRGCPEGPRFLLFFCIADLRFPPRLTMSRGRTTSLPSIKSNHAIGGRRRHTGAANPGPGSSAEGRPRRGDSDTAVGVLDSLPEEHGRAPTSGTSSPLHPERVAAGTVCRDGLQEASIKPLE